MYILRIIRRRSRKKAKPLSEAEKARYEQLRAEAKAVLPARLDALAQAYGFQYNKLHLKHNRSNWGSCSSKKNINLNITLVLLPQELCDYVCLHELCHLQFLNHGQEFHTLLNNLCIRHLGSTEEPFRRELRRYRAFSGEKFFVK